MSYTEVTGMYRLVDAMERVAISLERIEAHLANHQDELAADDQRNMIRVKVDKDGDPWFELVPGLWTWGNASQSLGSAKRLAERYRTSEGRSVTNVVDLPEAELDESDYAPFIEAHPVAGH